MGDRVSISFVNEIDYIHDKVREESVTLFNHWGGKEFPQYALNWVKKLKREVNEKKEDNISTPYTRLEPQRVMVLFIADLQKDKQFADYTNKERITHSIYLGKDTNDGDNSDNGHFVIDINCEKIWS
mgnify:FL=1|jgi:hypothetical protein|tara:strand:- start:1661 stop:2041 length:381 start_codon:yes stop_codon:yes gene_type:complete